MHMRLSILLGVVAAASLAACHKDTNGQLPTTPPSDSTATSTNGLNIALDTSFRHDTVVVHTAIPVAVRVTKAGVGVPNTTVTWTVSGGGGSVASATSTTDASGLATMSWTIGDTARTNDLTATITGASVGITVTAVGGAPTILTKITPDSSVVVAGATLLLVARATDRFGNPAFGVNVNWSASAGALSIPSTTTGASGNAQVGFVSPTTAGSSFVTASVPGLGSVTFKVVGL
jgi:adhesin/invasin